MAVDAIDIAEEIRNAVPGTEEIVVQYLAGYLVDDAGEDEDTFQVTRSILESAIAEEKQGALDELLQRLGDMLAEQNNVRVKSKGPTIRRLGNVLDMSTTGVMSNTLAFSEGVDLESINKSKASRVDVKKLEKQEAKLRAKIEKRAKRDLYEGSKLLESQRKQQSYEEIFMKVNSLEAAASAKGKSKDIHLPAIDVSFGSNRILSGATLTLAYGRRYGLIGRNGVGKSTLLRHIALREVPIPAHITILFVEQEVIGDDTPAIESVLKADVWRDHLLREEQHLNLHLAELEKQTDMQNSGAKDEAQSRLTEVHERLADMDAASGPARAAALLAGLGFSEADQSKPTKQFSGGWRMRLALARALFVKPHLLLLDEPSNHIDLNALAWLEDYLQTWPGTILVVSHDRAFLDSVATDIVHQHSNRLDYYKGNFTQFYATKSERERNMRKEYETQLAYRQHLQAFIDRWRYNANRASQAQMKIKILEKLPDLEPPPSEDTEKFKFPETEKISPPLLQLSNVSFGYAPERILLGGVDIDVGLDSRIAVVGANGAGKSTLIKLLTGELSPLSGHVNRNGRVRVAYFSQHHVDTLIPTMTPVSFLALRFPGKSEQEYRNHLGSFGLTGIIGLQLIGTLSGGQKSRVAFAVLSLQQPHILLLDEPTNHLDIEGLDALMAALTTWNGGVIVISHDERFITTVAKELWVCADGTVHKFPGDVQSYKLISRASCGASSQTVTQSVARLVRSLQASITGPCVIQQMMSDFEAEDQFSDSGSEGYAPVSKKTKAAPKSGKSQSKPAAPKSKPSGTTKKKITKVLKEIDENSAERMDVDSVVDLDVDIDAGPSKRPLTPPPPPEGKDKTATQMYQKLTQLEHILKRPDSYIGSIEAHTQNMWVYDSENKRMINREITYVPGFFKIVDEILVNAADNKINDPNMSTLKVNIDPEEGSISIYNDGKGIPIEMHATEKIFIPELIFGHLLTSSNYDDEEKKLTGGRNGYGAKLANIYSFEFIVETADKNTSQKYKQTWTDNMTKVGKAKITKTSGNLEFTRITFRPDFKRFGMERIDDDTLALLKKRVYDMAGTVKDVKVFLNDERLKVKNFKQYVELYLSSVAAVASENSGGAAAMKQPVIHEQLSSRWEVAFAVSDGSPQQVSFANSISTTKGGTHVQLIQDQIAKHLMAFITKKNKGATVKANQIKNHMWIFVNALIENPTFDSQTKEMLTLTASKFGGSKPVLSEDFLKRVTKTPIIENILNWAKFKADQEIKKTDGSKRTRLSGLTKLSDANNAGGKYASKCTLILTEGDSAKALAVAGLSVAGRDNFGVFPLRGKLLNVREANHTQIMKNEEIQNIKKILGLQHNKEYASVSNLRYGSLMIMTDQDHDGSHIKGLLINFLDHFYPSLLRIPNFLVEFITPIVRVTKGNESINFYTLPEYEQWLEQTPNSHRWKQKYYKGLGTSTDEDARLYFRQMEKHMIPFTPVKIEDRELIDLAFSKKKIEERKDWLRQFKPGTYLNHDVDEIPISDFINKELILFSMADNIRSIPSVVDGLKPGQRKVLFGTFKKKLKSEIKVQQLVGYISEQAQYHHGETSLMSTIVALAQDFVGSNNVNLLKPDGQYGTRERGGKDHASARYIHTMQSSLARVVFNSADDPLLNYQIEDGKSIEPDWYMPILPVVLLNGVEGIGTGWSTSIPNFNPVDVVENLKRLMAGEEQVPMLPWWRGFTGEVKKIGDHKYEVYGRAECTDAKTIEITELPIYKWTQDFKGELEALCGEKGDGPLKDYKEHSTTTSVSFTLTMSEKEVSRAAEQGLLNYFKLVTKVSTNNMMCFDAEGKIKKYNTPEEVIEEFYNIRLAYYQKRKDFLAGELESQLEKLSNQVRFVQMIIKKELVVSGRKKADIVADLKRKDFKPIPKVVKVKAPADLEDVPEEEEEETSGGSNTDYDYLLGMAIWNLTQEKVEKLKQQQGEKEAELMVLLKRTPTEIWSEDLNAFLAEWDRACKEWVQVHGGNDKGKSTKRKQTTLKTRKSLGEPREDSDDDFKPTKAKAKKAPAPAPKEASIVTTSKEKLPLQHPKIEESDSEAEIIPAPRSKPLAKPSSITKIDSADESDVKLKAKGKGKASAKRKSDTFEIDSDEDEKPPKKAKTVKKDVVPKAVAPASKAKPRTVSNPKKTTALKKIDSDVEEEGSIDHIPTPLPRETGPKRMARVQPKKYIEIESDNGDDDDDFVI